MRETTNEAYEINEVASYVIELVLNSTSARLIESVTIESQYCPFVSLTCDSTSKYRSYNGTCNNLDNPLYGGSNTPYK
ncbi:unnamed protein product [Brachionus calyciflorus]|uniref:Uncharacterized protein n=1 Tax=Brachionus calyciflorus TaxID=104777 RepID=A0A813T7F6_9BILA|nr:unnamed protein product [Brachionus calyciflorus]